MGSSVAEVIDSRIFEEKKPIAHVEPVVDELFFLRGLSPAWRFIVLTACVFIVWMTHSIATEYTFFGFGADEFPFGFVFTMIQFTIYAIISSSVLKYQGKSLLLFESFSSSSRVPLKWWLYLAVLVVASSGLANQALAFVNFPTLLVFKNSKVLFVMIAGVCVFKKSFSRFDLFASAFLVAGLILLSVANLASVSFNMTGILLLSIALFADSILSNLQERLMTGFKVDSNQVMFGSQSLAAIILLLLSVSYGHLAPGIHFFVTHPRSMIMVILTCIIGYIGCYLVLTFMKKYGAFIAVTTTSCRKCVSIFLSFLLFPKPLTWRFAFAIFLVFIGIAINIYAKNRKEGDKEPKKEIQTEDDAEKESCIINIMPSSPAERGY